MFPRRRAGLLDLRFREVHRQRPRALFSPFLDHDRSHPEVLADGGLAHLSSPRVPFVTVALDVADVPGGGALLAGLDGPTGSVLARWLPSTGRLTLEVDGGRGPVLVADAELRLDLPAVLAVAVHENQVTVLAGPDEHALRPLLTERDRVRQEIDLRDVAVLGGLRFAYGVQDAAGTPGAPGAGGASLTRVRAGLSGPVGVRDPQVVRHPDGSPHVVDGRVLLTMTSAGLGFFQQAHWGVWALDLGDPRRIEQVGELYTERDGVLLGDHAGHLVVDEEAGEVQVLVSSWGDHDHERGVHVRHATAGLDLLSGVHVLRTERVALPTRHSAWDPSLARIDGRWHLGFTECVAFQPRYVFHPALAVTEDRDPVVGLQLVGADSAREQTEGSLLQRVGRDWAVLASDGDAREYPVYDLRLRQRGVLSAPYGSNIPHPALVRAGGGRRAPWWLVTFDGTPWHDDVLGYGTHGDLVVMAAPPRR
ncbi:hypothetical protein [Modestobacter sp. SYSU DS0290]